MCLYVRAYNKTDTVMEIRIKTDRRASKSSRQQQHLILYFNYFRYFIGSKKYACCAYIKHVGMVDSISRLIHGIA